ncbi:MAG: transglutaminase-like domain-containing protein [Candidatus Hadarchaeales archaeon]
MRRHAHADPGGKRKRASLLMAALTMSPLILSLSLPPAGALRLSPSYTSVVVEFQILEDRTVRVGENCVLNLPSFYSSITIKRTLPSENVQELEAWCEPGELRLENRTVEEGTEVTLTISFSSPFRGELRYGLSYRAAGWVGGAGPKYEAVLGGVRIGAGGYPYESYRITIRGPPGSKLFWHEPRDAVPSADGLSVTYSTSVGAPGSFGGMLATFYTTPVYYKLTLTESLGNSGGSSCDLVMNLLLFSEGKAHFASLVTSDPSPGSLYADEENNFYASFRLKLAPGENKRVKVELVWKVELYDPGISSENSGTLDDLPQGMEEYTVERKWWEVEELRPLSLQLTGGERNLYLLCRELLRWMDGAIAYVPTQERQGALETYRRGAGDCDCLSDLLIALLRSLGVPSRLSFGWTAEENGAGNHAWVEVHLPGWGWQPVDPTWSKGSEKYLFRMDPLHLCRGSRGLTSSDSYLSRAYYGGYPEVGLEEVSLVLLSEEEALQEFLLSARTLLCLAEEGGEDPRLEVARESLRRAENGGGMEEALRSLSLSLSVLRERGKPLELPRRVPTWALALLAGSAAALALALGLGLRRRA